MRNLLVLPFLFLVLTACGDTKSTSDLTTAAADMTVVATADMAVVCCGNVGDTGNSKGVGKFCNESKDCGAGLICGNLLGDVRMHFCTTVCTVDMGDACGEGASCVTQAVGSGCVPTKCLTSAPAGCLM